MCKWFISASHRDKELALYGSERKVVEKALDLITSWNRAEFTPGLTIRLNKPDIWVFKPSQGPGAAAKVGEYHIAEPFITNYQKFNSNTGWASSGTNWTEIMQAVSHYSYHVSSGQYLLCDLQGGLFRDGAILTDPVIMSRREGGYGPTDLGPDGMSSFFASHRCNTYCKCQWTKPAVIKQIHKASAATSMAGRAHANPYVSQAGVFTTYQEEEQEDDYTNYY